MRESWAYVMVPSHLGSVGIVWEETPLSVAVQRIYLPGPEESIRGRIAVDYPRATKGSSAIITDLVNDMAAFLAGEAVAIGVDLLALDTCTMFQRKVLFAEHGIPRGWVSTYGRLAGYLGVPKAARAVGSALATNPFPLVIPCHRAVRAGGELGGFQGGLPMKRMLLEMEGVEFDVSGRVRMMRVYY